MHAWMCEPQTLRRCEYRSSLIAWRRKLEKFCDAPTEYDICKNYYQR